MSLDTEQSQSLSAFLPLQAPSMNILYSVYCLGRVPQVHLKGEVRLFKTRVIQMLPKWKCPKEGWLAVHLDFCQPWHYQNGQPKHQDVANMFKMVLDGIAARYGFDDSRVVELTCRKIEATPVGIRVGIRLSGLAQGLT